MFDEVSSTFAKLSQCPSAVEDRDLLALERFVVLLYDRSSDVTTVNEIRLILFARKQRPYHSIPITPAALKEHAKRASYHAGHLRQALIQQLETTSLSDRGWTKQGEVENPLDSLQLL